MRRSTARKWNGSGGCTRRTGPSLIETFSHERAAGALIDRLGEKLAAHGVPLSPLPRSDAFAVLERQGRIDPFLRLLATFLHHFKGSRLSLRGRRPPRRGRRRPLACGGVSGRIQTGLRALPANPLQPRTDRLSRHDRQGRGTRGGGALPQPVRLHPGRRVPGHLSFKGEAAEGVARPVPRGPVVRRRRRLAGDIPLRRIRHRRHARVRGALRRQRAGEPGDDLQVPRGHRRGRDPLRPRQPRPDTQEGAFDAPRGRPVRARGGLPGSRGFPC